MPFQVAFNVCSDSAQDSTNMRSLLSRPCHLPSSSVIHPSCSLSHLCPPNNILADYKKSPSATGYSRHITAFHSSISLPLKQYLGIVSPSGSLNELNRECGLECRRNLTFSCSVAAKRIIWAFLIVVVFVESLFFCVIVKKEKLTKKLRCAEKLWENGFSVEIEILLQVCN